MPEKVFVGREKYIQTFREMLTAPPGSPYILNLRGPGGMGKTKILEKFVEICRKDNILNTGIIDFYSSELNSRISTLELAIIDKLANKQETGSFLSYQKLRRQSNKNRTLERGQKLKKQFVQDLEDWARHKKTSITGKRPVLLFDTFEQAKDNIVGRRIIEDWLPVLGSTVVVISGRQTMGELKFPTEVANLVIDQPIEKFNHHEAEDYLKFRGVWQTIVDDKMVERCFEVTELRPLRLALSVDWLIQNATGDITPANLFGREKDKFEYELVVGLEDVTKRPESVIIPYMAHLPRPFDAELLEFLNLPEFAEHSSEDIFANLSELSFVKHTRDHRGRDFYWFQDELRELYHQYIFKHSNRANEIQKEASQKMLEFHDSRIKEATDARKKQKHQARRLYHEIYLNPVDGYQHYRRLFKEGRRTSETGFTSMLVEVMRNSVYLLANEQQTFAFKLDEVRWLKDIGNPNLAYERGMALLAQYRDIPKPKMFTCNALGGVLERLGNLNQALEFYTESLKLTKELKERERLCQEMMNIGKVNRVMGKVKTAIENFTQAYDYAMKYNITDIETVARATVELGYTYATAGQPEIGLDYCNSAIDIVKGKDEYRSSFVEFKVTRGAIYRMLGYYQRSTQDINDAITVYSQKNYLDNYALAVTYFELAFTQWFASEEPDDSELLKTSLENFKNSIRFGREFNRLALPRALNQVSNIYWKMGDKDKARDCNNEAYDLAKENNDIQYTIDSLVGKAEFDFDDGQYEELHNYANDLENDFEKQGYEYLLFYGRMKRILAEVAFNQENYEQAIEYYSIGLHQISEHKGHATIYNLSYELERLENKLQTTSVDIRLKICQKLQDNWLELEKDRLNSKLISWATRLINGLIFQPKN